MSQSPRSLPIPSLLQACCEKADCYPENLAPRLGNKVVLQSHAKRLRDSERRIFRANRGKIHITEVLSGNHDDCEIRPLDQEDRPRKCLVSESRSKIQVEDSHQLSLSPCVQNLAFGSSQELKEHLEYPLLNGLKDATSRHIFVHAGSNRFQLDCSASVFKYISSYHEISPDFLKLVHSLGNQFRPARSEHFGRCFEEVHTRDALSDDTSESAPIEQDAAPKGRNGPLSIPSFNRSGSELRCFYQLNGVEPGEVDDKGVQRWSIRQTTVYHSFDTEGSRQLWLTIKANSQMRKRFEEKTKSEVLGSPNYAKSLQHLDEAFKSSLSAHQLHLEWCVEGWRWHIDEQEIELRSIIEKIKDSPVSYNQTTNIFRQRSTYDKSQPDLGASTFTRFDSWISRPSRKSTVNTDGGAKDKTSRVNSWLGAISRRNTIEEDEKAIGSPQPLAHETAVAHLEANDQIQRYMNTEGIFGPFTIGGYQDLTAYGIRFQDIKLAINSNLRVLDGIRRTYTSFIESDECSELIKASCKKNVGQFVRRINSMEAELTYEHQRLDALICQLQDVKPLYESILQYRSMKANEAMASHSRYASLRMEAVSEKTERLTSSMHVITTFTLLLLPGTFLGSLFSTDIISRGDTGVKLDFVLGSLFLKICLPMMVMSLVAWAFYVLHKHRRAKSRKVGMIRLEEGIYESEKQKALEQGNP